METFKSLLIYGSALFITMFICTLVQDRAIKSKRGAIFYAAVIALPFTLLAGCRYNVGTDYKNYVDRFFQIERYGIREYLIKYGDLEPIFVTIVRTLQILGLNSAKIFGVFGFIVVFFPALAFVENKEKVDIDFAFLIYYLVFYHYSLNIVRQILAVGIIIYAVPKLMQQKYWQYLFWTVLAYLFHASAMVAFCFVVVPITEGLREKDGYKLLRKSFGKERKVTSLYFVKPTPSKFNLFADIKRWQTSWRIHPIEAANAAKKKRRVARLLKIWEAIYVPALLLSPIILYVAINVLLTLPVLNQYRHYLNENVDIGFGLPVLVVLLYAPILLVCRKTLKENWEVKKLVYLSLFYIPFAFIGYFSIVGGRIRLYSDAVFILMLPMLCCKQKGKYKKWIIAFYTAYFLLNYVDLFVLGNAAETFPFRWIFYYNV